MNTTIDFINNINDIKSLQYILDNINTFKNKIETIKMTELLGEDIIKVDNCFKCKLCVMPIKNKKHIKQHSNRKGHKEIKEVLNHNSKKNGDKIYTINNDTYSCSLCNIDNIKPKDLVKHNLSQEHNNNCYKEFFCNICDIGCCNLEKLNKCKDTNNHKECLEDMKEDYEKYNYPCYCLCCNIGFKDSEDYSDHIDEDDNHIINKRKMSIEKRLEKKEYITLLKNIFDK